MYASINFREPGVMYRWMEVRFTNMLFISPDVVKGIIQCTNCRAMLEVKNRNLVNCFGLRRGCSLGGFCFPLLSRCAERWSFPLFLNDEALIGRKVIFVELNSLTIHLLNEELHSRYNSIGFLGQPDDRIPCLVTRVTHRNAIRKSAFRFIVPSKIKRNNVFNSYFVWRSPIFVFPFLHRHIAGRAALPVALDLNVSIPWFFIMWAGRLRLLTLGF